MASEKTEAELLKETQAELADAKRLIAAIERAWLAAVAKTPFEIWSAMPEDTSAERYAKSAYYSEHRGWSWESGGIVKFANQPPPSFPRS